MDGASAWRRFRDVTLPMISPTLFFVVHHPHDRGLQIFDQVYTAFFNPVDAVRHRRVAHVRDLPLPAGVHVLPHGLRVGARVAAVRLIIGRDGRSRSSSAGASSTTKGAQAMSDERAPAARRRPTAALAAASSRLAPAAALAARGDAAARSRRCFYLAASRGLQRSSSSTRSSGSSARRSSRATTSSTTTRLIPQPFHRSNYLDVFRGVSDIATGAVRCAGSATASGSASLAALTVTFSSALVAFAFAYFRFPLRNFLFGCVLATMMLPGVVTMIPIYLIWNKLTSRAWPYTLEEPVPALGAEPLRQRVLHLPAAPVLPRHPARATSRLRAWTATTTSRCSGGSRCRSRSRR